MGKKLNPALIGAFVIGAVVLVVIAAMIWGSGRLFERTDTYVAYFPGSVNGLNVGAPVKLRGVQIGQVSDIRLRYKQARGEPRIPVFLKIDEARVRELGAPRAPTPEVVREFVAQGWRARLQAQSLVTGVLYIEFDLEPAIPAELVQDEDAEYPEIPTVPTTLEQAAASAREILAELKAVDWKGIVDGVNEALAGVNRLVRNPQLEATIAELPSTIAAARRLATNLDTRTGPLAASAQATVDEARRGIESLRATLGDVRTLLAPEAPLAVELTRTVNDLGQAARALRDLAQYLERNPNAVVFGRADGSP